MRWLLLTAAIGLAGILVLARRLVPDPRGYGTHTQLGLRPCAFLTVTGRPCPTCGMTTAFAWLLRGRVIRSWQVNPAGCLLGLLSFPLIAWLISCAVANRPVGFQSLEGPLVSLILAAVAISLVVWLVRLIVSPQALVQPGAFARAVGRPVGK
jgi:hypothetical protein